MNTSIPNDKKQIITGFLAVLTAFLLWGNLPLYWLQLFHLPFAAIVAYRIIWSWIFIVILLTVTRTWSHVWAVAQDKKKLILFFLSAALINTNWITYMLAISTEHVIEASMGYYMNPLMNALFGALFFKEVMRPLQKLAILFMIAGVGYMIIGYGSVPVFAIVLAMSFVLYATIHKFIQSRATESMFFEMSYFLVPAVGYFIWLAHSGGHSFFSEKFSMQVIIALAGPLTMIPLMGFSYGVKRLQLTTVGIMQYISPTSTFIIGLVVFKEQLTDGMLVVFTLIWAGVIIYLVDALARQVLKKMRQGPVI